MILENERLCVEIAERGAEVVRIYDKKKAREVLWNGDPKFWKRHSPILFPNVGKTWNHEVFYDGVKYPSSQHGFARDSDFIRIKEGKSEAVYLLRSSEETKEVYPLISSCTSHINWRRTGSGSAGRSEIPPISPCTSLLEDIPLSGAPRTARRGIHIS